MEVPLKNLAKLHLPYLDGLRGFCALYVVMNHILLQYTNIESLNVTNFLYALFKYGRFSVDVFIVLSGYCLMIPLVRSQNYVVRSNFLLKRAKRIYLPYFLAVCLSLFLIYFFIGKKTGNLWDGSIPVSAKDITYHLLLIHDIFADTFSKINYPFWSISVECRIYLFFPFLIFVYRKFGVLITFITTLLISFVLLLLSVNIGHNIELYSSGVNPYIILFFFGMLASEISLGSRFKYKNYQIYLLLIISVALLVTAEIAKKRYGGYLIPEMVDIAVGLVSLLLLILVHNGTWLTSIFSWKPLVFIGTFAFSIYLIHSLIIQMVWVYIYTPEKSLILSVFELIGLSIPLVLAGSYLFFLFCERPFMRQKKTDNTTLESKGVTNPVQLLKL